MKRAAALLLSLMLLLSCLPMTVFAAFTDEANWKDSEAWAKEEINYMVGKEILNGYPEDGAFHPDWPVTRSQFVKMMVETFGLTAEADINYSDVAAADWYYPYVKKAAAQGFLLNYGNYFAPNENLSRQEAAALLARYMKLEADEKVPSSTYPDYNSIRSEYREYILQVTYAGLFNGDANGNFRPDGILKRCEAAAILYRAAGTIYKASATGTETAANPENAVIGVSGITVSDATIKGKLLITEGASNGTVTLSGCNVETLVLRGTSSLILSGCTVDEIIVDCSKAGHTASVSLVSGSAVDTVTAKTPVEMNSVQRTSVKKITIQNTAKNSAFLGAGTLTAATVNAAGFESSVVPTSYTIASGITAVFAGNQYTSTGTGADAGFAADPSTYAYTAGCHLTAKPVGSGILYYYFTNAAEAPSKDAYNAAYVAAGKKSYISVTANVTVDQKIADASEVSEYAYVVLMLQTSTGVKYQPKVVVNKASSGFATTPVVSENGSYEKLSFISNVTGLVSYYYTNTATVPAAASFAANCAAAQEMGMLPVTANKAFGENLCAKADVSSYAYIALQLKDTAGNLYQPIVISRTGAAVVTESGFTKAPTAVVEAGKVVLKLTAGENGTIEYYYSTLPTAPTYEQFTENLGMISESLVVLTGVAKGENFSEALSDQIAAKCYPYVVVRLTDSDGTEYQPVVVSLPTPSTEGLSASGFLTMPSTRALSGKFQISVQTTSAGRLYYYITDNSTVPNVDSFRRNYADKTTSKLSAPIGGESIVGLGKQNILTDITNQMGLDCNYIVLMMEITTTSSYLTPTTTALQPIVISLIGAQEKSLVSDSNGFTRLPTYTEKTSARAELSLTASESGNVWYYFTEDPTIPEPDKLKELVQLETENNALYAGTRTVTKNKNKKIDIQLAMYTPAYIIVMLEDETGVCYQPVVVSTGSGQTTVGSAAAYGFVSVPTAQDSGLLTTVSYNALETGSILWYYTNTPTAPETATDFFSAYIAAGMGSGGTSGVITVSATGEKTAPLASVGQNYIALLFRKSDNTYYKPLLISTNGSSIGGTSGISGFVGNPYVQNGVLHYQPAVRGTLYYCLTDADNAKDLSDMMSDLSDPTTAAMMALFSGTAEITSTGTKMLVLPNMLGQMGISFKNIAIWIDAGGYETDMLFVPISGGIGGTTPTATGFSSAPLPGPDGSVYVTPAVSGTVKYFYTNVTTEYTYSTFANGYSSAFAYGNVKGTIPVTANAPILISAPTVGTYTTLWIMVENGTGIYSPVKVTLP